VCVCVCVHLGRRCSAWQHRAERCADRWPRTCSCRCLRAECLNGTTSSVLRSYIDRRTVRLYILVIKNIMQDARRQRKLYNVIHHHRMLGIILWDFFSVTLHRILSASHWYVILSDSSDIKSRIIATSGPVSTGIGDRLWAGIPSRYVTSQQGQLSLASLRGG